MKTLTNYVRPDTGTPPPHVPGDEFNVLRARRARVMRSCRHDTYKWHPSNVCRGVVLTTELGEGESFVVQPHTKYRQYH